MTKLPPHSSSSFEPPNPFHGVDEETRELIQTLLWEKDKARQNYAAETLRTEAQSGVIPGRAISC